MTISEEFIPIEGGQQFDTAPSYPSIFGITLTPQISGLLIGLLGLAGSIYLAINLVMPTWQRNQELQASRNQKQAQVEQKQASLRQSEQVKTELAQAKQQNAEVLALFANEKTLDTLLLDLNRLVESGNGQLQGSSVRAKMTRFEPDNKAPELIADSSLGAEVNGKLKRQVVNVEIEGAFEQTQSILRNVERLQPLLIVKDYESKLVPERSDVEDAVVGGPPTITTSFQLQALIPATPEERAQAVAAVEANQPKK